MQDQSAPLKEGLGILRTLLQGAPSDPAQLEQVLKQGLKESGLFYEAHLSRWFSGDYTLEELLQEPQGKLLVPPHEGRPVVAQGAQEGSDPRTMAIVKEQLAALQTSQLLFHGELFPGQPMEWRIKDREGRGRGGDEQEQAAPWETSLALTLPKLGRVEVALSLKGAHLDLVIEAGQERAASLMEQGRGELQDQLLAAGLEPGSIVVKHGP
jgi:hypothetical protein